MSCGDPLESATESQLTAKKQALAPVNVREMVAAGANHSLFLEKNGDVWAWGQNNAGQAGTGSASTTPVHTPTKVSGVTRIKSIAAGVAFSLALDVDEAVWAWGQNTLGQAGQGSTSATVLQPVKV
ncbi:RCC1 domain-containing protein, partial [Corallococcus terminator]